MIRVGIVGCNYGRTVLLPAFRTEPRCQVVALAGTDAARTAEIAREANVARGTGDWAALVEDRAVDAVAVAVPPALQPEVARRALDLGKPVFVEKPLAADLAAAQAMLESALRSGRPTVIDFNFPELPAWRRAKAMLDAGAVGRLRHVVVTWNVENQATRLRLEELEDAWRTAAAVCWAISSAIASIISNGFAARSRASAAAPLHCPRATRTAASRWRWHSPRAPAAACR